SFWELPRFCSARIFANIRTFSPATFQPSISASIPGAPGRSLASFLEGCSAVGAWPHPSVLKNCLPSSKRLPIRSQALCPIQPSAPCSQSRGQRVRRQPKQSKKQRQRSEEHTSELQSRIELVCRLLLAK